MFPQVHIFSNLNYIMVVKTSYHSLLTQMTCSPFIIVEPRVRSWVQDTRKIRMEVNNWLLIICMIQMCLANSRTRRESLNWS